jgi:hypothetical protein
MRPRFPQNPRGRRSSAPRGARFGAVLAIVLFTLPIGALSTGSATARPAAELSGLEPFLRSNGVTPPPTVLGAMAYDASDGYLVMFGGQDVNQDTLGTTWEFKGGNWTNLTPTLSIEPPPRYSAAMAWDSADHELVLFGGCPNPQCVPALGDTWVFGNGHWTDLTPKLNTSPTARASASMTYDPTGNGSIVLFGGDGGGNGAKAMNDTWTFHGGVWSDATPPVGRLSPPPRNSAAFVYDPALGESVLFGGGYANGVLADTWAYSKGNWTDLTAAQTSAPSARRGAQAVYDSADGYLLLLGGYENGAYYGDTWTFGPKGWAALATSNPPEARYAAEIGYDGADSVVVLFSGVGLSGDFTGTWTYSGGSWELILNPPGATPPIVIVGALLIFLTVLFALILGASILSQRWRLRHQTPGFTLSPNEPVQWVEGKPPRARQAFLAAMVTVFALVILLPLALVGSGSSAASVAVLVVFVLLFIAVFVGLTVVVNRQSQIYRVGIAPGGVVFGRRAGDTRVAWNYLSPASFQGQRSMFLFQYTTAGRRPRTAFAVVTVAQAKAIIASPYAPQWPLSHDQAKPLGLQMRTAPPPPPPPGVPAAAPGAPMPGAPLPAGPAPASSPLPSLSWPTPAPPPAPPPPPVVLAPSTDHLVRCGRCGQTFPNTGVAFCPACGARLI